jgi:hypothetical protein
MFVFKHRVLINEVNRLILNFVIRKNKQQFSKPARRALLENIHHLHCVTEIPLLFINEMVIFCTFKITPKNYDTRCL